ncbi:MAG: family 78 glycoside hydrolase catalytic domain [Clostridia bacterium]|nr:family 78 glycoside hydrolase catalytic domain [Clostridia bacterium]
MTQSQIFGTARWVQAGTPGPDLQRPARPDSPHFPILRRTFDVTSVKKATLQVLGLGFFTCRINGVPVSEDHFLPLFTDYQPRKDYPIEEKVTGHRIYVPEYDVTPLLREGKNALTIHFGGGWYTADSSFYEATRKFGDAKAIYRLTLETEAGVEELVSSTADQFTDSFVKTYDLITHEDQDYRGYDETIHGVDFDDSALPCVSEAAPLPEETRYLRTDAPADRLAETLPVTLLGCDGDTKYYAVEKEITGWPVLKLKAAPGELVTVYFSENVLENGKPDPVYHHSQRFSVISDGKERLVRPEFTWFAYRYFSVTGNAEVEVCEFIHSDIAVTASFRSDNITLNWLFDTFVNTELCNLHTGVASDCPHLERRGYTGDGQLTGHAVMNIFDVENFYRKWMGDISDCQDIYSGHIQYTAPYIRSGGGPGGWGSAIVEVPYVFWRHYGDVEPLKKYYHQMLRYFDYLEAHSANELVVSDKAGEWCLGDWCPPIQVVLPAPFVNTYFYVKALGRMIEIAKLVGCEWDIPRFQRTMEVKKAAIMAAYFNTWDGNFIGCFQGANAFALDIGLGDERTLPKLVEYYEKLGRYDTGIAGTEVLTRVLFENGHGDLAVKLLTSTDPISFEGMRQAGATTLWENWPHATWDRSRNHPMFGAVTAFLFDYILGIREGVGGKTLEIAPILVDSLDQASGSRVLKSGEVKVAYEKKYGTTRFSITTPVKATFRVGEVERILEAGEHEFTL